MLRELGGVTEQLLSETSHFQFETDHEKLEMYTSSLVNQTLAEFIKPERETSTNFVSVFQILLLLCPFKTR